MIKKRVKEFDCSDMFVTRWSPRALTHENVNKDILMKLFEAARWAPSSYNEQPWRIIYALNGEKGWSEIYESMVEFNQSWTKTAGALLVICSTKTFSKNNKENRHNGFDAGSAWMSIALEAQKLGLYAHGMAGFDTEKIRKSFSIPNDVEIYALVAIGGLGKKEDLPSEMQEQEILSSRKKVEDFAFEGEFKVQ